MPGPNAWQSIPTTLLDLGQKTADAESWAAAQRATLAETWANVQRQAVQTMADTYQRGTDTLDHFTGGYQGARDAATGPTAPPGYNDMAGASSSGSAPAFGSNSEDVTSPIDQARNVVGASSSPSPFTSDWPSVTVPSANPAPQPLPQLLGGDQPLTDIGNQIAQGQQGRMANLDYRSFPTLGTRADQPAREQPALSGFNRGFTPSQVNAQNEAAANIAMGSTGIEKVGAEAGVTRMFHGTGSSFGVPDASHFDPNGLFGPGYYLTSDARVAGGVVNDAGHLVTKGYAQQRPPLGDLSPADVTKRALDILTGQYPHARPGSTIGDAITEVRRTLAKLRPDMTPVEQRAASADLIPHMAGSPTVLAAFDDAANQLRTQGAQTRAVSVPNDLKLLHADAPAPKGLEDSIANHLASFSDSMAETFSDAVPHKPTGADIYSALQHTGEGDLEWVNTQLQAVGFDGVRYEGGKRIPMTDAAGSPIEHTAINIFPESMGKLTNAISGTKFGSPPAVGGAIVGGLAGATQPAQTPQERAKNIAMGAAAGGVGAYGLQKLGENGNLGRLASEDVGAVGRVPRTAAPGEQRAGNILLRKFDPGVQDVIDEAASTNPNTVESARRGVVSDQTVQDLANAAGTSVQKVIDRWKPGQAANAETIQALRTALDTQARKVLDAQQAIQGGDNSTASQLRFQLAVKEHLAVQQAVSGVTAEAGRGLRVLRQSVQQALQSNDVTRMQGLLKKLGGAEWTDELSAKLGQLDTSDPTAVHTFLRDAGKAKAPDYLNEWLYNAILSNPSTHIANGVSNTVNALLGPVERVASAAVEAPLAALQGRPRERFFGEATANAYGLLQGLPEGIRAGTYALQHGFSEMSAVKGEMPRPQAFKGPLGNALNTPSRLLTAADAFFQPIMQRGALNAEIFRKAASEGLKGQALSTRIAELTANVPADLMERAGKMAEYQLYRQEPGKFGKWLSQGRNTVQIGPVQPLRFVLPFVQVPLNATKYGLERSPLGFLNPALWGKMGAIARKDPEAADMLARAGIGSLVTASIASQVAAGNLDITGAAPQSPPAKDAFYRQGKLPFALKIGGQWYSYQRWEPFNHALTQVAAGIDAVRNAKAGADPTSIAGQAALTIGQNVLTQTFLSGIGSLINAATDPQRYGESFVAQLETSMVPASAAMRAAANVADPRQRAPQGIAQNVENVIPGLSRNVPSRLNNYGEEQGIAGSPLLPYKSQTANDSPLELELARLRVEPGAAGKSVRGIDLTRQENQDYQRLSGGLVKAALTQVMQDPRYRSLDDTRKAAALTRIIGHAKDLAAQRFIGQLAASQGKAALLQRIAAKKRAQLPKAG